MSLPHKYYEVGTLAVDGWAVTYGTARRTLGGAAARPLLTVPNVTAHPSTASVPITVLLYNGPLYCGFNVRYNCQCRTSVYACPSVRSWSCDLHVCFSKVGKPLTDLTTKRIPVKLRWGADQQCVALYLWVNMIPRSLTAWTLSTSHNATGYTTYWDVVQLTSTGDLMPSTGDLLLLVVVGWHQLETWCHQLETYYYW